MGLLTSFVLLEAVAIVNLDGDFFSATAEADDSTYLTLEAGLTVETVFSVAALGASLACYARFLIAGVLMLRFYSSFSPLNISRYFFF